MIKAGICCRPSSGLRLSLLVGMMATASALILGTSVGIVAAYVGGRLDAVLMRLVDIQLSFPAILIALILVTILGKGVDRVVIALISVQWAYYARTIRSSALVERRREYIEAARGLALPHWRIMFRHLLPTAFRRWSWSRRCKSPAIGLGRRVTFLGVGVPITDVARPLIANGYGAALSATGSRSIRPCSAHRDHRAQPARRPAG
jgi:peptide/nickel transport system permease protein